MKEARYLIRLAHAEAYKALDQPALLARVREIIQPLGGKAINLRVSRRALEFDLFCNPDAELHPFLTALEPIGAVLTYKRLDLPPASLLPAQVIAEARSLFNEERFWEVHEVLEGLWKTASGDEKRLLQGLILTAAALVHTQKNEMKVVTPMLEDAARRLENQPSIYYGLDVRRFLREVKKMILTKTLHFPTI
jgi:uncharacterized protein